MPASVAKSARTLVAYHNGIKQGLRRTAMRRSAIFACAMIASGRKRDELINSSAESEKAFEVDNVCR